MVPSSTFSAANRVVVPCRADNHGFGVPASRAVSGRIASCVRSQCLNLAFLVDTENNCFVGRIHIQADDVAYLREPRKSGSLLNLNDSSRWGWKPVLFPDPLHRGRTHLLAGRHRAHTPMCCVLRFGFDRRQHNRCFLLLRDPFGTPAARTIFKQGFYPTLLEPLPPQQHRRQRSGQILARNRMICGIPSGSARRMMSTRRAISSRSGCGSR